MLKLSVIVLNYGTADLAIACAKSALADIAGLDAALIVVDNASPDGSLARLSDWRASLGDAAPVTVISSPKNSGYAGGNNFGIAAREAEFYALLNSDTVVRPGAFAAMLAALAADPAIGVLGPRIVSPDGEPQVSRFRHPTPLSEFVAATGADVFYRMLPRHVVPIFPAETTAPEWIGFPCVMLRQRMIADIGLLDEGYFLYFEDCDYCRRAGAKGWRIAQTANAEVVHVGGASTGVEAQIAAQKRLPAYYYASRRRYFVKWHGEAGFIAANVFWYLGRAANYARLLAFRRPTPVSASRARDIWAHGGEKNRAHGDGGNPPYPPFSRGGGKGPANPSS